MGLFGQAKDLYKMQKQAKAIKAKLKNMHIEAEVNGVKVTINGEQEVVSTEILDAELLNGDNKAKLEEALKTAFNKAIKKSQEVAANEMRDLMGGLGMDLPNLGEA